MMMTVRAIAAVLLAVGTLSACGDDDSTDAATSTTSSSTSTSADTTSSSSSTSTTAASDDIVIEVSGGSVVGGAQRHKVELGEDVTIRVTSDVADHVHVHGYDLLADVGPGTDAVIEFEATIPGVFEIELEDRGLEIAKLEVA
jgi:hypothetical protein